MSDPKSDARADTRTGEVRSESWIEAGLEEIARTGVEGVRVEVLAKSLGVTKGGFYRRFRDRAALLEAMLQNWSEACEMKCLAKRLAVTKGGFYRRFRDRAALLEAMLQNWSEGRIAAIERHT